MRTTRITKVLMLVAAVCFAAACGKGGDGVKTVEIDGNDQMQFSKTKFNVKAGETVRLTLKNVGTMPKDQMGHNLVILTKGTYAADFGSALANAEASGASVDTLWLPTKDPLKGQVLQATKLLGPGESETLEFTAPAEKGSYEYLCSFPGHFVQMKGTMFVK